MISFVISCYIYTVVHDLMTWSIRFLNHVISYIKKYIPRNYVKMVDEQDLLSE